MATTPDASGAPPFPEVLRDGFAASRALLVGIAPNGPMIPGYGTQVSPRPTIELDVAGLELAHLLARGDAWTTDSLVAEVLARVPTADPARLHDLLAELADRDLLVAGGLAPLPPCAQDPDVALVASGAAPADDDRLVATTPTLFRPTADGFEHIDHDGRVLSRLSPAEVHAVSQFRLAATLAEGRERHLAEAGPSALEPGAFDQLVATQVAAGLVQRFDPDHPNHTREEREDRELREAIGRMVKVINDMDARVAEQAVAEAALREIGVNRVKVVPIDTNWQLPPASLGLIIAYAKAYEGGRLEQAYSFHPRWLADELQLRALAAEPAIYLFSNYVWNYRDNLALSALVKQLNPHCVTIHGGPNTPKYQGDCEQFFADNPHVDITVRGEGEETFAEILAALEGKVGDGPADLSGLRDVKGLSYRSASGPAHTEGRDRIADLDTIPSPYLTGLFDSYLAGPTSAMILETNRGCPYGCTFCDWGSATLSRIRKFDIDRIFGELEWAAHNKIHGVSIADANFGIFERDVEIAEKIAELKATYGYPQMIGNNYAKNTVKHLRKIIELFADAGIVAEGVVSLQSMDQDTLLTIRRKNIKVEKYDDLAGEFRANQLPLAVDLMTGLPGATPESMRNDVQSAINRDVRVRLHPTQLLPNSPMNEPSYKAEHGITVGLGEYVNETTTFTKDEWARMMDIDRMVLVCDMFGVLRQVTKFVRQATGVREIDYYERLVEDALEDPERWPTISFVLRAVFDLMVPPVSWRLFIDEIRAHAIERLGVPADSALETVLQVQHALLPSAGRTFPLELSLEHDYAAWHAQVIEAREAGHLDDWHEVVPPLREFGPATFPVDDPEEVCIRSIGRHLGALSFTFASWELRSPVARARISMRQPVAGAS